MTLVAGVPSFQETPPLAELWGGAGVIPASRQVGLAGNMNGNAYSGGGAPVAEAVVVVAEEAPIPDGRASLDRYFETRSAAEVAKHDLDPATLEAIQEDAERWLRYHDASLFEPGTVEDYAVYDREKVGARLNGLSSYLHRRWGREITGFEADATEAFVGSAFDMWESRGTQKDKHDGSFAFVVPPRVSRDTPEYGEELADLIHVMRYVKPEQRAAMLRNTPPWIVDRYKADEQGRHGYLVCASVSGDMMQDLSKTSVGEARMAARNMVNDAVDVAADGLGVWAIGYGATFPGLMKYGTETRRDDVVTTTGHGGTIVQIASVIDKMYPERSDVTRLGVIGLGAIGAPAAQILAELYPGARVMIHDTVARNVRNVMDAEPGRFTPATDAAHLINESDVVVSAVTRPVNLEGVTNMDGTLVVDDSQPAQFDAKEVEARGGVVAWPIGTDASGNISREFCGYGDLMAKKLTDLFGCEAEVAALVRERAALVARGFDVRVATKMVGLMAIRGPVTVQDVHNIGVLFRDHGITASDPQSFGVLRDVAARTGKGHPGGGRPGGDPTAPTPHAA